MDGSPQAIVLLNCCQSTVGVSGEFLFGVRHEYVDDGDKCAVWCV